MIESCDVLVAGGGPAGSSCARRLREAGLDVLLLDKAEFPRDKVCAGWITPPILQALGLDPADYARDRVFQPIRAFRAGSIGGPLVDVDFPQPVSFGIRRCEFDHYLLARCGARLRLGEPLETLERRKDGWLVNDRYRAPMLVGAGGHFCPVAQRLGNATDLPQPVVAAQEIEFPLDARQQEHCPVEGNRPELYFCRDLMGYGWCFRKGDFLNVGLGREDRHRLSEHVGHLLRLLEARGPHSWRRPRSNAGPCLPAFPAFAPQVAGGWGRPGRRRRRTGLYPKRRRDPPGDRVGTAGRRRDPRSGRRLPPAAVGGLRRADRLAFWPAMFAPRAG